MYTLEFLLPINKQYFKKNKESLDKNVILIYGGYNCNFKMDDNLFIWCSELEELVYAVGKVINCNIDINSDDYANYIVYKTRKADSYCIIQYSTISEEHKDILKQSNLDLRSTRVSVNPGEISRLAQIFSMELTPLEYRGNLGGRPLQKKFRNFLLEDLHQCILCNIKNPILLNASHIVPFSKSDDGAEYDKNNGLLLCIMHDYLFDKHLISFNSERKIEINPILNTNLEELNLDKDFILSSEIYDSRATYLDQHYKRFLEKKDKKNKKRKRKNTVRK